jgi:outer membrane protein insertion porin family
MIPRLRRGRHIKPSTYMLGFFIPKRTMLKTVMILAISGLIGFRAFAQENYADYEITRLSFQGNDLLKTDDLSSVVQTKETPSWFWKLLYNVSESVGKKPEYFSPTLFRNDVIQLKRYYAINGFFQTGVDTSIAVDHDAKSVTLTFRIEEGPRSFIDTLRYLGFEGLPGDLLDGINNHKLIEIGDPYVEKKVEDERRRVMDIFANYGYVQVHVDTLQPIHYASTNNITILFAITPGDRYKFGGIQVRNDSTVHQRVDEAVILRHLDFKPGDFYNLAAKTESEINLNRLGVFEFAKIEEVITDTTLKSLTIPIDIFVRARPFYELAPEIGLNDERGYTNLYFGLGYFDRNFFGGLRNFTSRFRLNVHAFQDLNFMHAFSVKGLRDSTILTNADLTVNLIQPYFINNKTSLSTALFAALEKQRTYYSPILRFRIGVAAQTATYTRAFIDWNLEIIHPQSTITGRDTALGVGASTESRAQFNSIISFTLQRDMRNDFFSPSKGFFHSVAIEEAGLLPFLMEQVFGSSLPYAKYVKITALGQWYWDPGQTRSLVWATKLRAGAAQLYGRSPTNVPLTRRFYAGGSASVRGWRSRDLGEVVQPDAGGSALVEGSLEARWNPLKDASNLWFFETRKLSFVLFYDTGNLWAEGKEITLSEFAMAAGVGLRYETVAGPIRLDFGWKVYDPAAPVSRQWITQKRFVGESLPDVVFHLGVGQAF